MKLELVESRKNSILAMISVVSTNNIESLNLALEGDLGVIEIERARGRRQWSRMSGWIGPPVADEEWQVMARTKATENQAIRLS